MIHLADEIKEEIIAYVGDRRELVQLACTCRSLASIIIPRHTEHRILRLAGPRPLLWIHLSQRPDLAALIREIDFLGLTSSYRMKAFVERLPFSCLSLDDSQPILTNPNSDVGDICTALRLMKNLEVCRWGDSSNVSKPLVSRDSEMLVVAELLAHPSLRELQLAFGSSRDSEVVSQMIWNTPNLNHLVLKRRWRWLETHPSFRQLNLLTELEIWGLLHFSVFDSTMFPFLKTLKMYRSSRTANESICNFLAKHPSIEDLLWESTGLVWLKPHTLPNLKFATVEKLFVVSLETAYMTAAVATGAPAAKWKLQKLFSPIRVEHLNSLTCIDREALTGFKIMEYTPHTVIKELADNFPNIEWLWLASEVTDDEKKPYMSYDDWHAFAFIPRFKKLKRIIDTESWESFYPDDKTMENTVLRLAVLCPHLEQLRSSMFIPEGDLEIGIYIVRAHVDPGEAINYHIRPGEVVTGNQLVWYEVREIESGVVKYISNAPKTV